MTDNRLLIADRLHNPLARFRLAFPMPTRPVASASKRMVASRAQTGLGILRWYYLATPLFWIAARVWGVDVRVAFLDDFPVGQDAYYLACCVVGLVVWRAPERAARLGLMESTLNVSLLIVSVMVWYGHMLDWAAGPSAAVRVVTARQLVNFVLAAVVAAVSYGLHRAG